MGSTDLASLYRRFGPILFSHFVRRLADEGQAMKATRYAFEALLDSGLETEAQVVRWIRALQTPQEVACTESLY